MSVIYPKSLQFFDEYIAGLNNQTFKDFSLFLFGDGIRKKDIASKLRTCNLKLIFTPIKNKLSIPKVREIAIKQIKKQNYDLCIFTDSDEFVDENFVKSLSEKLKKGYKVVFSDIFLYYHETKKTVHNYLLDLVPNEINVDFIIDKNCLGLGNSGLDLNAFDETLSFPTDIIAVDWWLFTRILHTGLKAGFVKDTFSYYRLYDNNLAGFLNLDEKRIIGGVKTKKLHYKNLCDLGEPFIKLYKDFRNLDENLKIDETFKKKYIYKVLEKYKSSKYLFWEPILNIR